MKPYRDIMAARAAKARRYRASHPDRKRAANARYYANNREKCLDINKRWRAKNHSWLKRQWKIRRVTGWAPTLAQLKIEFPNG